MPTYLARLVVGVLASHIHYIKRLTIFSVARFYWIVIGNERRSLGFSSANCYTNWFFPLCCCKYLKWHFTKRAFFVSLFVLITEPITAIKINIVLFVCVCVLYIDDTTKLVVLYKIGAVEICVHSIRILSNRVVEQHMHNPVYSNENCVFLLCSMFFLCQIHGRWTSNKKKLWKISI